MKHILHISILILFGATFLATQNQCSNNAKSTNSGTQPQDKATSIDLSPEFKDYWFQGQAELNIYEVEQERYGEIRPAQQVMVFVTEDFSKEKQVKLDNAAQAGADRLPVLKINSIRRFHTGIYDYSLMESIFSPLNGSPTLKTSTTVQDWCGQTFTQINSVEEGYRIQAFSYFESEGDSENILPAPAMLESEFWTRIRMQPASIREGEYQIIPSALFSRLRHVPLSPNLAEVSMTVEMTTPATTLLQINYLEIPRTLHIRFEANFPYRILGWEESYQGKFMSKGQIQSTRKSAYWTLNGLSNNVLRDSLFLSF